MIKGFAAKMKEFAARQQEKPQEEKELLEKLLQEGKWYLEDVMNHHEPVPFTAYLFVVAVHDGWNYFHVLYLLANDGKIGSVHGPWLLAEKEESYYNDKIRAGIVCEVNMK